MGNTPTTDTTNAGHTRSSPRNNGSPFVRGIGSGARGQHPSSGGRVDSEDMGINTTPLATNRANSVGTTHVQQEGGGFDKNLDKNRVLAAQSMGIAVQHFVENNGALMPLLLQAFTNWSIFYMEPDKSYTLSEIMNDYVRFAKQQNSRKRLRNPLSPILYTPPKEKKQELDAILAGNNDGFGYASVSGEGEALQAQAVSPAGTENPMYRPMPSPTPYGTDATGRDLADLMKMQAVGNNTAATATSTLASTLHMQADHIIASQQSSLKYTVPFGMFAGCEHELTVDDIVQYLPPPGKLDKYPHTTHQRIVREIGVRNPHQDPAETVVRLDVYDRMTRQRVLQGNSPKAKNLLKVWWDIPIAPSRRVRCNTR